MTHPIDRLGEIRQQIRTLSKEAKEIITKLDAGAITDKGLRYAARTHQRVVVHPIPQPAPPDHYSYQNPLSYQQPWQNQAQNLPNTFGAGSFGQGGFGIGQSGMGIGQSGIGVGKREG